MALNFAVNTIFGAKDEQTKAFNRMGKSAALFGDKSERAFRKANRSATMFGSTLKALLAADAIKQAGRGFMGVIKSFISESSKIEDAVAGFTPLLGGVEKATTLVDKLNETAATTPFQFEGITGVAKQLLPVMNGSIEDTVKTFRMLGDTAGGNIEKLDSITRGYVKALLKGKPDMEAMNMIAEAGVPIFSELSASMGITKAQMFDMSKKGKITTADLTKAFERMTKEGGIFFRGMDIASKTLTGKFSTFKDNVALTAAAIGQQLNPTIKDIVDRGTQFAVSVRNWVTTNKDFIKSGIDKFLSTIRTLFDKLKGPTIALFTAVKKLFSAFATAASSLFPKFASEGGNLTNVIIMLMSALETLANIGTMTFRFIAWASPFLKPFIATLLVFKGAVLVVTTAIKLWAIAQTALNIIMTMNPIGLVIAGIAALIAGIVLLVTHWDSVANAVKNVWNLFLKLLDNPLIAATGAVFAPFITIPALIIKHWEPIKAFFMSIWEIVKNVVDMFNNIANSGIAKIGNLVGGIFGGETKAAEPVRQAPQRVDVNSSQRVDVGGTFNFNNAPQGMTFNQSPGAPAIDIAGLGAMGA